MSEATKERKELASPIGSDLAWAMSWGYETGIPCAMCGEPLTDDNYFFGQGAWICNKTCRPPRQNQ